MFIKSSAAALFTLIFSLFLVVPVQADQLADSLFSERPKVGIAFSGGGAKGFAHIGVLKVLEEINMPIDYISGTSMGALVHWLQPGIHAGPGTEPELGGTVFRRNTPQVYAHGRKILGRTVSYYSSIQKRPAPVTCRFGSRAAYINVAFKFDLELPAHQRL
jgi:hypothetical protein